MSPPGKSEAAGTVAVIGGGLSGMAAAAALCDRGFGVELFESRPQLGGRAASFHDAEWGAILVDRCQHVAMGCCTNLADFCRRTGVADCFRPHRRLHFISPEATRHTFGAAPLLPAPLHLLPGLLRLGYLSVGDRFRILRTLGRLARHTEQPEEQPQAIGPWLRDQGESDRAIERFWSVVLVSALGETLDRASLAAARKVFVDGFLTSRRSYELEVPQIPLETICNDRLAGWLTSRNVTIHRSTKIRNIEGDAARAAAIVLPDDTRRAFDFFVLAVPWHRVRTLLSEEILQALPALAGVDQIESSPITAVHLWFDRPFTSLPHAALVGRLSQWLFHGPPPRSDAGHPTAGHYYQVVISASRQLENRSRPEIKSQVHDELATIWPALRQSRLLHWRVINNPQAVFSTAPGVDRHRPPQATPIPNLALAGDWTHTNWPSTMESAIRSGHLAAQAILKSTGHPQPLLAPDLPPRLLARRLLTTPNRP